MDTRNFFLFAALILRTIWEIRNKLIFEGVECYIEEQVNLIYQKYLEFLAFVLANSSRAETRASSSWCKPPLGTIKINSDATIGRNFAGVSLVARNHLGNFLLIKAFKEKVDNLEVAEAIAIYRAVTAITLAIEEGYSTVICESDAKSVIESIKDSRIPPHWTAVSILRKIWELIPSFESISFLWTPRQINVLAHLVARWSLVNVNLDLVSRSVLPNLFVSTMNQESDC
nr:uncharacterized protein LOC125423442 [Ziziphus jujuba var. spinosa]